MRSKNIFQCKQMKMFSLNGGCNLETNCPNGEDEEGRICNCI